MNVWLVWEGGYEASLLGAAEALSRLAGRIETRYNTERNPQ